MTIGTEFYAGVLLAIALVAALFAAAAFVMFRVPVGSLRDQVATARFMFGYDDALTWLGVGGKARKSLRSELAANIHDAAADAPVATVLARLGNPKELARDVAAGPSRPTWMHGLVAAACVWVSIQLATFVGVDVLADSIDGRANATADAAPALLPGLDFSVATDAAGVVNEVTVYYGPLPVLAPIIALILFARPWRLLNRGAAGKP